MSFNTDPRFHPEGGVETGGKVSTGTARVEIRAEEGRDTENSENTAGEATPRSQAPLGNASAEALLRDEEAELPGLSSQAELGN